MIFRPSSSMLLEQDLACRTDWIGRGIADRAGVPPFALLGLVTAKTLGEKPTVCRHPAWQNLGGRRTIKIGDNDAARRNPKRPSPPRLWPQCRNRRPLRQKGPGIGRPERTPSTAVSAAPPLVDGHAGQRGLRSPAAIAALNRGRAPVGNPNQFLGKRRMGSAKSRAVASTARASVSGPASIALDLI